MERSMSIIDYIFPSDCKCIFCERETSAGLICDDCYSRLHFLHGKLCKKCGGEIVGDGDLCLDCKELNHAFERNFSILEYSGDVQSQILKLKNGYRYIAGAFSDILCEYFEKMDIPFDMIIPIPIHENRRRERGFNQCELLCDGISRYYGRVYTNILVRIKDTPHQTGLSRANRITNLDKSFKVLEPKRVKNKIILLVDDIYTTGSTMHECAKTLLKAGAKLVYGLTLARPQVSDFSSS